MLAEGIALALIVALKFLEVYFAEVPLIEIVPIFITISFAMLLGVIFTELPSGADHTFLRLGLATFCRTSIPLLVVAVIWKYSVCDSKVEPILAAIVFYAVGHFGGMILGTLPLKQRPIQRQ